MRCGGLLAAPHTPVAAAMSRLRLMTAKPIDWSQLWYPGPKRAFTAEEMARAGSDGPSATLLTIAGINIALVFVMVLQVAPQAVTARLTGLLMFIVLLGYGAGRWLWWRPWRRPLMQMSLGMAVLLGLVAAGLRWRLPDREERMAFVLLLSMAAFAVLTLMWFLVVWRAQQIESRLREQAERAQAIEMARRLAAAQIEPHFLFNTLASVQHWVQTRDERAGPLLAALTGYLRATLPLFKHEVLRAGDELVAVQRYLEVMQSRMGERLRWRLAVAAGLEEALLPPGLLLTLVENAVAHGAEPQLAGADIVLSARREGGDAVFEVRDNGPGPAPQAQDGVGLANARQRLLLCAGSAARLTLSPAPGGGCSAVIRLPCRSHAA